MNEWVNFRLLKQQVRMVDVICRYNVSLQLLGHGVLRGRCPLPAHCSKDSALSFSINSARDVWACHSQSCVAARGGVIGGNVLDFVAVMEGCSIRAAALLLQGWFGVVASPASNRMRPTETSARAPANRVLGFRLFGLDASHPYISSRGISAATARLFGIGYYGAPGFLSGRVAIPIHNPSGALIAYAGRSVGGEPPKYKLPPSFRKSAELFNLHRAAHGSSRVVLVEGFFDCMKVHQAGFPNVVALMGCSLSPRQGDLLAEHFAEVILLLDGDEAGERASEKVAASLRGSLKVHRGRTPTGLQPDELSADDLRRIIGDAVREP
jgi:DNA primase